MMASESCSEVSVVHIPSLGMARDLFKVQTLP